MKNKVDEYLTKHVDFQDVLSGLRKIILSTELEETIKWGMPTYTLNGKNVLSISAFKHHCGIWFFQGGLLKDSSNILINAQEGKTKAMRQMKFIEDSIIDEDLVKLYVLEAIENEKKGLKIKFEKKELIIPQELEMLLKENKKLTDCFDSLTFGKKREFSDYISEAKRQETKAKRLEKIIPMIINNIGLHDKYKNC